MDFDGDERTDIISGSWPGDMYLFRRQPDGSFAAGEIIRPKDDTTGNATAIYAHDWDADGDLDLLSGNVDGSVYFLANEGKSGEAAENKKFSFGKPIKLKAGGRPIAVPRGDAGPLVADWDGDGRDDLLVGTGAGDVQFYRNMGDPDEGGGPGPKLAAATLLVGKSGESSGLLSKLFGGKTKEQKTGELTDEPGTRTKICTADWNNDGKLDLLVGDFSMKPQEKKEVPEDQKEAVANAKQKYQEVLQQYFEFVEKVQDKSGDVPEEYQAKVQELTTELTKHVEVFKKYEQTHRYHGWVWLYLRGDDAEPVAQAAPASTE